MRTYASGAPEGTIRWSISIRDVGTGQILLDENSDQALRTASVGKVLLLIHAAREITLGRLSPAERLARTDADRVADSGIWQYLSIPTLCVGDLAELIGAASDNLATNVLLRRVGLSNVAATATDLGLSATALHDQVRDRRGPEHPQTLSSGSAGELADLMVRLARGEIYGGVVSELVLSWLAKGLDLSQVAAAWALDPLAHIDPDRGLTLHHKTGTDTTVRADIGILRGPAAPIAYAVIANWDDGCDDGEQRDPRDDVLARMYTLGRQIAQAAAATLGAGYR